MGESKYPEDKYLEDVMQRANEYKQSYERGLASTFALGRYAEDVPELVAEIGRYRGRNKALRFENDQLKKFLRWWVDTANQWEVPEDKWGIAHALLGLPTPD